MIGIYKIENILNGMKYIGQSINVPHRLKEHKRDLKYGRSHNDHLQKSHNKYGIENFTFEVIDKCNASELDDLEIYWINLFKSNKRGFGFNIESGGRKNKNISDETKLKISKALTGFKVSDATKLKQSISRTGIKFSNEWRQNIRLSRTGKKQSEEAKLNMSNAKKGKIYPNMHIFKKGITAHNKGVKLSIELRLENLNNYYHTKDISISENMINDVKYGISRRSFILKYKYYGLYKIINEFYISNNIDLRELRINTKINEMMKSDIASGISRREFANKHGLCKNADGIWNYIRKINKVA